MATKAYLKVKAKAKRKGVSPPGGNGAWQLTPDQRDRNAERSRRKVLPPRDPVRAKNTQWT